MVNLLLPSEKLQGGPKKRHGTPRQRDRSSSERGVSALATGIGATLESQHTRHISSHSFDEP